MKIREVKTFNLHEYLTVLQLLQQLVSVCNLPDENEFSQIIESENSHLFLAELNENEIIGMVSVGSYRTPSGPKFWIEDVVVDKNHTGKGYGKQLVLYAIKFSESSGAKDIFLTSRNSRIFANRLYQKLGFIKQETNKYKLNLK